jgi:hypothetical protein
MEGIEHLRERGFSERTIAIAEHCEGMSLIEADICLDDVRRFIWIRQFSGASREALEKELAPVPVAYEIIDAIGEATPLDAEELFLEVRLYLWMSTFIRVPQSQFSQMFEATIEKGQGATIHYMPWCQGEKPH